MPVIGWLYNGMRNESFLSAFRRGPGRINFVEAKASQLSIAANQPASACRPPRPSQSFW